jgi:hypothetical protein
MSVIGPLLPLPSYAFATNSINDLRRRLYPAVATEHLTLEHRPCQDKGTSCLIRLLPEVRTSSPIDASDSRNTLPEGKDKTRTGFNTTGKKDFQVRTL